MKISPQPSGVPLALAGLQRAQAGFSLVEVAVAVGILSVAFVGLFGTVRQAGRMANAAESDVIVECALEQRVDQLRCLEWPDITSEVGLKTKIFNARPNGISGLRLDRETLTISPVDVPAAQTLSATWAMNTAPTSSATVGTTLITAKAVKAVATLTWSENGSGKKHTRSIVTVISRGGLSRSDRP